VTTAPRRASAALVIALGCVVHGPLAAQAGPVTPEDSVRALEDARGQALIHADTVALSRMVAADFTRVFVRRDGRWQAVTMQQTTVQ